MSERNKHDRGALVALGLILGAVVLIAGFSALSEILSQQIAPQAPSNIDQHYEDADYHVWGDSWAQWSMAAFAIVATSVSWRALYLLRRTFEETKRTADAAREANETARDIGEKQVRAYLSCVSGRYRVTHKTAVVYAILKNFGSSPAVRAVVTARLVIPNMNSVGNGDQLLYSPVVRGEANFISAGMDPEIVLMFPITFDAARHRALAEGDFLISADCSVEWDDVFGNPQAIPFFLVQATSTIVEADGKFPARREGSLSASNYRPPAAPLT